MATVSHTSEDIFAVRGYRTVSRTLQIMAGYAAFTKVSGIDKPLKQGGTAGDLNYISKYLVHKRAMSFATREQF